MTLAGIALLLVLGNTQVLAATIPADGVVCTLIEAIDSANRDTSVGDCASGNGDDAIELGAGSTHTLAEVNNDSEGPNGLPVIESTITIEGRGSTIQRDSTAPAFRLFVVGGDGDLTLRGTTISGGASSGFGGGVAGFGGDITLIESSVSGNTATRSGGGVAAVYGDSSLTLIASSITGNTTDGVGGGVAVYNARGRLSIMDSKVSGNLAESWGGGVFIFGASDGIWDSSIENSVISGNRAEQGGGIAVDALYGGGTGTTSISGSSISDNRAVHGGGIHTQSWSLDPGIPLEIVRSTISGNTAERNGGGIHTYCSSDYGYGPCYSPVSVATSTISGNQAGNSGGGLFADSGEIMDGILPVDIADTTLSGNVAGATGGGIAVFVDIQLRLSRTLISGNNGPIGPEIIAGSRSSILVVDDSNLFGLDGDSGVADFVPGSTDIVPGSGVLLANILNPKLADNGGPTLTHALVSGSPAIDAIPADDPECTGTDQRGVTRPQGAGCDIGASEFTGDAVPTSGKFTINHMWRKFCPEGFGQEAVVLLGPPTYNGKDPGVVRMRQAENAECPYQVRFQEWDYRRRDFDDRLHKREQVSYLGLSPGVYEMDDGSIWEVGSFQLSGTGYWKWIAFQSDFADPPSVFLTMQSTNGGQAATVRVKKVGPYGFKPAIFEEEYLMDSGHSREDIGYVAIYHPEASSSGRVEGQARFNGMDYAYTLHRIWADHQGAAVEGVELKLEEERSLDGEVNHLEEALDVLQIADQVFAQQVSSNGKDTTALRRR